MRYWMQIFLMIGVILLSGACNSDKPEINKGGDRVVEKTPNASLIDFIKGQKLANFPSTTIGSAFEAYRHVARKEWRASTLQVGYITVEFTGWIEPVTLNENDVKDGVIGKGIDITFVIEPGGAFYVYLISQIESKADGKVSRTKALDTAAILSDIYANRKLNL